MLKWDLWEEWEDWLPRPVLLQVLRCQRPAFAELMRMGCAAGVLPGVQELRDDFVHAGAMLDLGEDEGAFTAHLAGVALHDRQVGANGRGEVSLVDDEKVRLGDARAAFARDFVAAGNVNNIDGVVRQFAAEMRGQIVAAGFEKEDVGMKLPLEVFQREEVGGNVLANRGVRAAAGLHCSDTPGIERLMADQKLAVFLRENIVGNSRQARAVAQSPAKCEHQGGLAAAHRTPNADGKGALMEVAPKRLFAVEERARMDGVFMGMAIGTVRMRMSAHIFSGSTLKQSRIEAVLRSLPKIEQGRGLRNAGNAQMPALGENRLGARSQPVLQRLRFHRPRNAQPDRSRHQSAQVLKEKQARHPGPAHAKRSRDSAKDRRKMPQWNTPGHAANFGGAEDLSGRGEKRPALQTAGAIGDMIGEKTVAKAVQFTRPVRLVMGGSGKWQASVTELFQARFDE